MADFWTNHFNVYAQKGIQIIQAGPKAINDAYQYRLLLESSAVRLFAETASDEEVSALAQSVERSLEALTRFPEDREIRVAALDCDYQFHKELIDFQGNEIVSKHYSLNAARLRLFRTSLGEPLQRLELAAKEHLQVLQACRDRDPELAAQRLTAHIGISREHTLGIRPMR